MNPTLQKLINFVVENDTEREIYNIDSEKYIIQQYLDDSKSTWSKGKYYLGGHLPLDLNNEITLELIQKIKKLMNEDRYYCNSAEYASILRAERGLNSIEIIVRKYIEIQKLRILKQLEKTRLVSDVNNVIVSFLSKY